MSILAMIGPQHQNHLQHDYWEWVLGGSGIDIVDLHSDGVYWHELDAVNGSGDIYGWQIPTASNPDHLLACFQFEFTAVPVGNNIAVFETASAVSGNPSRLLTFGTDGKLYIQDKDNDNIGNTAALSANTVYNCLWYIDVRGTSRDMLWISTGAFGAAAIDVSGHGDYTVADHDFFVMGSMVGKTLPTSGGPCYVTQGAVIDLGDVPHIRPLGSAKVVVKMPTGNGEDTSFNDGPAFGDVDEVPYNRSDFDKATVSGQLTSYTLPSVDSGDLPIAVIPIGVNTQINSGGAMAGRAYVKQAGGAKDYTSGYAITGAPRGVSKQPGGVILRQDDNEWTEDLFNSLEVGYSADTIFSGDELELAQLGVLYCAEGAIALPDDFPLSSMRRGPAIGSANMMVV